MIAKILGDETFARWCENNYQDFKMNIYESIDAVMRLKGISHIPGCAEYGDCDPTSTAAAVIYCGEMNHLPQAQLKKMFDNYYADLSSRFRPGARYQFTPYEIRSATAFLFMGEKVKALESIRFMLTCRRPAPWNHLAEVVNSEYRNPNYLGDMPHAWVGAELVHAIRCLFAYEREDKLVLGRGVADEWLSRPEGVSVKGLPTSYGKISYTIRKTEDELQIKILGDNSTLPPGGFVFYIPESWKIKGVVVNGEPWKNFSDHSIMFDSIPADMRIR